MFNPEDATHTDPSSNRTNTSTHTGSRPVCNISNRRSGSDTQPSIRSTGSRFTEPLVSMPEKVPATLQGASRSEAGVRDADSVLERDHSARGSQATLAVTSRGEPSCRPRSAKCQY